MKIPTLTSLLFAAASMLSASAMAKSVSFDLSTIASTKTDLVTSLAFSKFDPSFGSLSSVHFDIYSAIDTSVKLTNLSGLNKIVTVGLNADLLFGVPGTATQALLGSVVLNDIVHLAPSVTGQPRTTAVVADSALLHGAFDYDSNLALFGGSGAMSAPLSVVAHSSSLGNSGVALSFNTFANAYGTVTYTYTAAPVPEPETYGMLLLGLGVMGFVAKRKARASQA